MTELSSVVDQFGVYIYKNPLIYYKAETFSNWKHRELTVIKDPIANAYIMRLNEETMTENPIFEPEILTGTTLDEWNKESWNNLIIGLMNAARTHSWCIVKLYDVLPYWKIFTHREITEMIYDRHDNIVGAKAEWSTPLFGTDKFKNHREYIKINNGENDAPAIFITFGAKEGGIWKYDLEAIWDLIIYARYQMLDIVNNSAKSSGFYRLIYGSAIDNTQKQDLINAMDYAGVGQAIGAKEEVLAGIESHYPAHPEFTVQAMDETLNLIAGATRLPLSFFRGEKEGGGVFQEGFSDEAKVTKKKKYIFGQFKQFIIQLVKMRWGKEVKDVNAYIQEEIDAEKAEEQEAKGQFENDHFNNNKENKNVKEMKKDA